MPRRRPGSGRSRQPEPQGLHRSRTAHHPGAPDPCRHVRDLSRQEISRDQTLRPGRRREPGADDRADLRRGAWPGRSRARNGPPWAAERPPNIMDRPTQIFAEFEVWPATVRFGVRDVYPEHLGRPGVQADGPSLADRKSSHLECVNTVVLGKVRAKQHQRGDIRREQVMGVLLHGAQHYRSGRGGRDLPSGQADGYETGGTIHVVINNQIGFTTAPSKSRSSPIAPTWQRRSTRRSSM